MRGVIPQHLILACTGAHHSYTICRHDRSSTAQPAKTSSESMIGRASTAREQANPVEARPRGRAPDERDQHPSKAGAYRTALA